MKKRERTADIGATPKTTSKVKRSKKSRQEVGTTENAQAGWQTVTAGEDFHTGLDEDGFMGLEVLDAPTIFSTAKAAGGATVANTGKHTVSAAVAVAPAAGKDAASGGSGSGSPDMPKKEGKKRDKAKRGAWKKAGAAAAPGAQQPDPPGSRMAPDAAQPSGEPTAMVAADGGSAGDGAGAAVHQEAAEELWQRVQAQKQRVAAAKERKRSVRLILPPRRLPHLFLRVMSKRSSHPARSQTQSQCCRRRVNRHNTASQTLDAAEKATWQVALTNRHVDASSNVRLTSDQQPKFVMQKLDEAKEAAKQAALAKGDFVMPEGLSRKEQKKALATHKREKHKVRAPNITLYDIPNATAKFGDGCAGEAQLQQGA